MKAKRPALSNVALLSILIQSVFTTAVIMLLAAYVKPYILAGLLSILSLTTIYILVQLLVPRHHNKGMRFTKKGDYQKAIDEFMKSYAFFTKHKWVDKHRYITALSYNDAYYAEWALCYIAYNYSLAGDLEKAREYYERAIMEFPKSVMAKASLNKFIDESGKG